MKISRSHFIKRLWGLLLLPYVMLVLLTSEKNRQLYSKHKLRITGNVPPGYSFYNDVIVVNSDDNIRIFSSRCTHLGCKINKVQNNELICPCHGSSFSVEGEVKKGPANKNLTELNFLIDNNTNEIVIDI